MSIRLNVVGACERIVAEASRLAGQNYAFNMQKKTGALDFITSPENGGVDATLISQQAGRKLAKLHIYYDQRTKACEINYTNSNASVCDPGSTPVRKEADITISNYISTPVRSYSNDDMAALCNDTEAFMRERSFSDLVAAREIFSTRILADLDDAIGKNIEFDGTTTAAGAYKDIQLLFTANGQKTPQPGNFAEMIMDYENNQLTGTPAIIGQGNFELFAKLHGMSCCNATTPYGDAQILGDVRYYKDQNANSVLGPSRVIMASMGTFKLLTFNENANIAATGVNTSDKFNLVVPDPAGYPFSWNFDFYFDQCDKVWKSMYSILWGTFNTFRDDSFSADGESTSPDASPDCNDELDGMTGIFGYNIQAGS